MITTKKHGHPIKLPLFPPRRDSRVDFQGFCASLQLTSSRLQEVAPQLPLGGKEGGARFLPKHTRRSHQDQQAVLLRCRRSPLSHRSSTQR
ncbi:hypothetical protein B0T16DRAFT_410790 [Cercophora newfieldiana]|uniref:Uncharacterized protein n=1 Tax=Cercophora newfieldiana TaxID=92897 RepID=A0AA40CUK8_9PEZI|nr:hypothetical protein B0T16DRAFT_410790 [Cercophora newfieldiana]